jgi:YD repeat-containing protein
MPSREYVYDGLHRLKLAKRGAWTPGSPGTFTPGVDSQKWLLDQLGNWDNAWTDFGGNGLYSDSDELDDRGHNGVNELTQRVLKGQGPSSGDLTLDLAFDKNGNLRTEARQSGTASVNWRYTHDAWNRLVRIEVARGESWTLKSRYQYNGLNWRIAKRVDDDAANWQNIQSRPDCCSSSSVMAMRRAIERRALTVTSAIAAPISRP